MSTVLYVAVMAVVTYLIRAIPFACVRRRIRSPLLRSFLYYIPYTVLAAMTVPAVFYCTPDPVACAVGFAAAVGAALLRRSLLQVAISAVLGVLAGSAFTFLLGLI